MRPHAQVQRFHALEHNPRIEGRQRHAGGAHHWRKHATDQGLRAANRARQHPALTVKVLGARVDHQVGAHLGGPLQGRRAKTVIDHQQRPGVVRQVGQCLDVAHIGQRVGRCFGKQQLGGRPQGRAPFSDIGLRDKSGLDAEFAKQVANQPQRRAEHGTRTHHMVACLEQAHAHHENRTHAAGRAKGGFGAFECRQALLETGDRRVGGTRVGEAFFGAGKAPGRRFGVRLHEAAGQVQRFGVFAVLAFVHGNAHGQRVAVQVVRQFSGRHGHASCGLGSARRDTSTSLSSPIFSAVSARAEFIAAMVSAVTSPVT